MKEKIILYDWILDFINENYDSQYTITDLDDILWPKIKNLKTNPDIKNHMLRLNLYPIDLIDRLFNWEKCKTGRIVFENIDRYWQDYCEENDINDFDQIDIFPENKPKKLKIVFDT